MDKIDKTEKTNILVKKLKNYYLNIINIFIDQTG